MKKRKGVVLLELMASIFICIMMSFTVIKMVNINQQCATSMHQHRNHNDKLDKQLYADGNVFLEDIKIDIKHMELRTGSFSIPVKDIEVDYSDRDNTEKLFFVESVEVP